MQNPAANTAIQTSGIALVANFKVTLMQNARLHQLSSIRRVNRIRLEDKNEKIPGKSTE